MVTHEKSGGSLLKQGLRPKEYEKHADEINVKSFVRENVNVHLGSAVVPVVGLGGGLPTHVIEDANFLTSNSPFSSSSTLHSSLDPLSEHTDNVVTHLAEPSTGESESLLEFAEAPTSGLLPGTVAPGTPVVGENIYAENASALAEEAPAPPTETGLPEGAPSVAAPFEGGSEETGLPSTGESPLTAPPDEETSSETELSPEEGAPITAPPLEEEASPEAGLSPEEEPPVTAPPEEEAPPEIGLPPEEEPPVTAPPEEEAPPETGLPPEGEPPVTEPPEEEAPPETGLPPEEEPPVTEPPEEETPPETGLPPEEEQGPGRGEGRGQDKEDKEDKENQGKGKGKGENKEGDDDGYSFEKADSHELDPNGFSDHEAHGDTHSEGASVQEYHTGEADVDISGDSSGGVDQDPSG
ncbi:hypothetical protein [Coxiella burnetii]|uniref:hypothetical protein n=1 Tax=Coxiella burnetii TaxID=777 RepID=UPI001F5B2A60|nr:hypothetical protein [Coxiella burnetii]